MPPPQPSPQPFALYNPALLPPNLLLAEFTARRPLLNSLVDIVRHNAPAKPLQHALLVGSRGMGKTTTLWAVAYTVQADPELSRQWLPVVFDEESRRVGDLADFWLEALRQWEHAANDPGDRAQQLLDKADANIEDAARNDFLEKVDRSGRRALLLIDNLNDLLSSIHDPEPLHRLRAFLMDDSRVMVLGTATRYFDQITDLDQPFYDFFRVFDLRPLTLEEVKTSLLALAEARGEKSVPRALAERSGTVQGLYLLTGGNPRLIKTFYRLLAEGLRDDIRTDLERLLDEFTPYFKAVVDALPVQQQRIFDSVALAWDPVEVATVSRVTRLPSNQVSAQLRALGKAGLISEAASHPKRKTYLLADRFSNIHYLMRHGRAARNRFDWFVALVRFVFPDTELAPGDPYASACQAQLVARDSAKQSEAHSGIEKSIGLVPGAEECQFLLTKPSRNTPADWQSVLPSLAAWCAANPKNTKVFDFTMEGLLQYARLTKPADALALLQTLSDTSPFETLMDAFRAHADREHLNRLAPERQAVVIELLNRLSAPKVERPGGEIQLSP
jgi:hypothetical protein